jgi:hypothetical protein
VKAVRWMQFWFVTLQCNSYLTQCSNWIHIFLKVCMSLKKKKTNLLMAIYFSFFFFNLSIFWKLALFYVFIIPFGKCSSSLTTGFLHFAFQNFEEEIKRVESGDKCGYRPRRKWGEGGGRQSNISFPGVAEENVEMLISPSWNYLKHNLKKLVHNIKYSAHKIPKLLCGTCA